MMAFNGVLNIRHGVGKRLEEHIDRFSETEGLYRKIPKRQYAVLNFTDEVSDQTCTIMSGILSTTLRVPKLLSIERTIPLKIGTLLAFGGVRCVFLRNFMPAFVYLIPCMSMCDVQV